MAAFPAVTFGLALFAELSKLHEDVFFSPSSIASALALVEAGVTPNSEHAAALERVLGRPAPTTRVAPFATGPGAEVLSARAVFARSSIKDSYVRRAAELFDAVAAPLTNAMVINDFVKSKTAGHVTNLVDDGIAEDPLTQAILVDALYFKGSWAKKFDADLSIADAFRAPAGPVPCTMMTQETSFAYAKVEGLGEAVALDYEGERLRAVFILPDDDREGTQGDAALAAAAAAVAERYAKDLRPTQQTKVEVQLPKLDLKFGPVDVLSGGLDALGLSCLRDTDGGLLEMADAPDLRITKVIHAAVVTLDEAGTEASAATAAVVQLRSLPHPSPLLRFDRPFIFLIEETATGQPLFVGKVVNNIDAPPPYE